MVTARFPETYQWLLVAVQATPQAPVEWQAIRLSGQDALAVRASKRLRSDELLFTGFAATRLRMELDPVPLWRGDHVPIKQLIEDFARYLYLPRLKESAVLLQSISDGLALLTWERTHSPSRKVTMSHQSDIAACVAGKWWLSRRITSTAFWSSRILQRSSLKWRRRRPLRVLEPILLDLLNTDRRLELMVQQQVRRWEPRQRRPDPSVSTGRLPWSCRTMSA
jgi:hypothetical protein